MTQPNYPGQVQKNNSSSSRSAIEPSTDLRSSDLSKQQQKKISHWDHYIQFCTHWLRKVWSVLFGEMKQPVEQEENTTLLPLKDKMSSETSLQPNTDSCAMTCQRTEVMTKIGGPLAYIFIDTDAEAWLAETDAQREKLVRNKVVKGKWIFYIYDALWTADFLLHAVATRVKMFFS